MMLKLRGLIYIVSLLLLSAGSTIAQSLQLADSLRVKGERLQERGNFKEAEFYYKEAYNLYEVHRDTASLLITGVYYGEVLSYQSNMERAISLFNQLGKTPHPANNDSLKARIESDLGWIYKQLGDQDTAIKHLQRSISFAKKAKDSLLIGIGLNNLASAYLKKEQVEKALDYYKQALPIFETIDNTRSRAYVLSHIGSVYKQLSLFDKALEYYIRSQQITEELDNINMLASIYDKLGGLHRETGNYNEALIALQKSLEYRKESGNMQGIAGTLNQIGALFEELGNTNRSLDYYRKAQVLWHEIGNPSKLATSYEYLASALWRVGRKDEAAQYYKKALALKERVGHPISTANSLLNLVKVELDRYNITHASKYLTQANIIADSTQDQDLLRRTSQYHGILNTTKKNPNEALRHYKKALYYSKPLEINARLIPLMQLAYTFNTLGSDSSLHYGHLAIELIEKGRSKTGPLSQFKAGYFKKHVNFYIDMASWHLKHEKDIAEAYKLVESAKARALSDELVQAEQRIDESLPEDERIKRAQQLANITSLYSRLEQSSDEQKKENIQNKIRDKELAYASFQNQLQQEYPQYKQFKNPEPVSLKKAQAMCDTETAVLEYALSDRQLLIFFISRDRVKAKQFALGQHSGDPNLTARVQQFRQAIINRAPVDSLQSISAHLYKRLIEPFENELKAFKNIVIVPDRVLAYLPFEALSNKTNYLVTLYNIKYVPSLTGLTLISEPEQPSSKKMLAIGNSSNYSSSSESPLLPSVELEIETVSKLFNNSTVISSQSVTEQNVKAALQKKYSFVHIAAHSLIDEKNSFMSGILLGSDGNTETNLGNDGYLRSSEIYRLDIKSDMVVLSACQSGIGQLISGEGMLGLQRAFFNAGTSTVAVSLWDVYDRSTLHFMNRFYSEMKKKDRSWSEYWQAAMRWTGWDESMPFGQAADAMRKTKLAMLEHPQYRHPVYWAPFVVVGR